MTKNDNFENMTLEKLARMVVEGFTEVGGQLQELRTEIVDIKIRLAAVEDRLAIVEGRVTNMGNQLDRLFDEILGIKAELKHVATHDELKKLDVRVTALEKATFGAAS